MRSAAALRRKRITMSNPKNQSTEDGPAETLRCEDLFGSVLDALESMARQHCHNGWAEKDYNGQVAGTVVTDSGAISANASALEILAETAPPRFRIVAEGGRMVVGYWPENDPLMPNDRHGPQPPNPNNLPT